MTVVKENLPEKIKLFLANLNENPLAGLLAIYYFYLKDGTSAHHNDRLLLLLEPEYPLEDARNAIQLLQNRVQDQLFFPQNVLEPVILRHPSDWQMIDFQNEDCLVPNELQAFLDTKILIWGSDILSSFPTSERGSSEAVSLPLSPKKLKELGMHFPQFLPLLNPFICWQRHDFAIPRGKASAKIAHSLDHFFQAGVAKHLLLYGRYWGSGKTGLLYWVMKHCKESQLPFVYRTEFWKDQTTGRYIEGEWDDNPNTPIAVTQWILENRLSSPCVLLLDEVDFSPHPDLSDCLVIAAAKEIPQFVGTTRQQYDILDLMIDYPFSTIEIESILQNLINPAINSIFPGHLTREIAAKHHKWRFPKNVTDPAVAVRVASYSLGMAVDRIHKGQQPDQVTASDVNLWLLVADSPYIDHYAAVHDVHSEFFVFDGTNYVKADPFNPGPLP